MNTTTVALTTVLFAGLALAADDTPAPAQAAPAVNHPLITEILFDVPGGDRGDANQDGVRDAAGDEFVEIVNAGDSPIDLKGYRIVDEHGWMKFLHESASASDGSAEPAKGKHADPAKANDRDDNAVDFTFPALTLAPGEIVVVFNGYEANIPGPVGDAKSAPTQTNEKFHNARVFSMRCTSKYQAFSNDVETVMLLAPGGKAVSALQWDLTKEHAARNKNRDDRNSQQVKAGKGKDTPGGQDNASDAAVKAPRTPMTLPEGIRVEKLPNVRGSAQRSSKAEGFTEHPKADNTTFSPGQF